MRTILKHFLINTGTLYFISTMASGIEFSNGLTTLVITGAVLTLASMLVRPLINLLLLPINLITFGLFKWVSFAITLYLVTLLVTGFKISDFVFPGYSTYWFNLPQITLYGFFAFLAFSFIISFVSSTVYTIIK